MNIVFLRVSTVNEPEWFQHLQSLKKFFEQWIKYAFGEEVKILISVTTGVNSVQVEYDELRKSYLDPLVVFIVDELPDIWKGHAEGYTAPDYIVVKHTRSADWAPLYTTALRLSHELWHWILLDRGAVKNVWYFGVEKAQRNKLFEYWGEYKWWNFYYRYIRSNSVAGITKYATLTGVLDE
jgi:hypothetical protein